MDVGLAKFQPCAEELGANSRLLEQSSDDFFRNSATGVDYLIFFDGLHTSSQTFRDFTSTLAFSGSRTIWSIDDVLPSSALSSIPDLARWHRLRETLNSDEWQWHGDVFRSIMIISQSFVGFKFATIIDGGNAQTIIWRGMNDSQLSHSWEEIARFTYFDLIPDLSILNPYSEEDALETVRSSFLSTETLD